MINGSIPPTNPVILSAVGNEPLTELILSKTPADAFSIAAASMPMSDKILFVSKLGNPSWIPLNF